jgi:hypothetical protein
MVGTVIGENEQAAVAGRSSTRLLPVAAGAARRIAMQPSFWFAAAIVAGVLSVALAAWDGGSLHDGRLVYAR